LGEVCVSSDEDFFRPCPAMTSKVPELVFEEGEDLTPIFIPAPVLEA